MSECTSTYNKKSNTFSNELPSTSLDICKTQEERSDTPSGVVGVTATQEFMNMNKMLDDEFLQTLINELENTMNGDDNLKTFESKDGGGCELLTY